jgi:hypothetical protein
VAVWRSAAPFIRMSAGSANVTATLTTIFKFLLSWVALAPISIIMSGKLLGQLIKLTGQRQQWFQLSIPGVVKLRAVGAEAVLGFVLYICDLLLVGLAVGAQRIDQIFSRNFGSQLGPANALIVFCALLSVAVSAFIWLLTRAVGARQRRSDPVLEEHDRIISGLTAAKEGGGTHS